MTSSAEDQRFRDVLQTHHAPVQKNETPFEDSCFLGCDNAHFGTVLPIYQTFKATQIHSLNQERCLPIITSKSL
jgi:hypothetical protein